MYRALVGIGMLSGLLIAVTFTTTKPIIERNRSEALQRAVFQLFPAAAERRSYGLSPSGDLTADPEDGEQVHAAYDVQGKLLGVAIEARGMGYADTISVLYGYAPTQEAIVGIIVLASKETPGLGSKIETDPKFLANIEALDARLTPAGDALANAIVTVKQGEKTAPWQIDAITGATVSSQVIGDILNSSAGRWVPQLRPRLEQLAHEAQP